MRISKDAYALLNCFQQGFHPLGDHFSLHLTGEREDVNSFAPVTDSVRTPDPDPDPAPASVPVPDPVFALGPVPVPDPV